MAQEDSGNMATNQWYRQLVPDTVAYYRQLVPTHPRSVPITSTTIRYRSTPHTVQLVHLTLVPPYSGLVPTTGTIVLQLNTARPVPDTVGQHRQVVPT
eukprot:2747526-Rhodomonas_salina.1